MELSETLGDFFEFEENGSDFRTELVAGLTTFLTMSYIVIVNPAILSTVTTYIESATGVEEGGRTGMTALVVALLFIAALALVPVAAAVPIYASHIALVVVAVIMLANLTEIDWNDVTQAVPAGLTVFIMPFTFNIGYGIAAGIVSYPIVKSAVGEWDEIDVMQWGLALAFVVYFVVRTGGILGPSV